MVVLIAALPLLIAAFVMLGKVKPEEIAREGDTQIGIIDNTQVS